MIGQEDKFTHKTGEERGGKTLKEDENMDIQACSAMDCTGLIPALPQSEAELESYESLYPYLPAQAKGQPK